MNFITVRLAEHFDIAAFKLDMLANNFDTIFGGCNLLNGQYLKNGIPETLLNEVASIAARHDTRHANVPNLLDLVFKTTDVTAQIIVIPISNTFGINALGLTPAKG